MGISISSHRDALNVRSGRLFIDGAWRAPLADEPIPQLHPATQEEVALHMSAGADDVDLAVKAARRAFDEGPWPRMRARERKRIMQRIVDLILQHAVELSTLQTLDNGMPIKFSLHGRANATICADYFDHYAGWIDKLTGDVYPQYAEGVNLQMLTMRDPVGVVAAIIPWNAPLMMFALKVAPALAAGCTIVFKPSELASLCAIRLTEILEEAGLPNGVFNLVIGAGATGDALARHPGVDKITFTGSRPVGEHLMAVAAKGIKRVTLELGGKSAAIVFPDAGSVEHAATSLMSLCSTFLSGQVCSTPTRAVVHRSVYDEFLHHARRQVESVRFGDPFELDTTSAPLISRRQVDRVAHYIGKGREEGARLVFGGDRPGGDLRDGNWVNPTLFAEVDNRMTIAQEEIFGPVLAVIPFETEEEAVAIANDTEYGLSGGIYTTNLARAFRVAKAMRTGSVGINGYTVMPNSPAGGVKASGVGREGGYATIESFTETKTVILNLDP
jgi:aldehyde dehydrogenase (NAD+)